MESSTSNYLSSLHVLLHKLSSEVHKKNSTGSYPNIHSFNNSKHLISVIQEVDSFITLTDHSLNDSGAFSEDISKSTKNAFSHLHLFVNGYTISILAVIGLILNWIGILCHLYCIKLASINPFMMGFTPFSSISNLNLSTDFV